MSTKSEPAGESGETFQFGEFTYDSGSRLLTRNGVRKHLSRKGQRLLHILLLARSRAVSRETLYDALWPATFVSETNLAGVVNEVRRALGDDGRAYIRTAHGFGYAFDGEVTSVSTIGPIVATLVCAEQGYPLCKGENSIGRALDCRVVLTDRTISRRHAVITIYDDDGAFSIRDLESRNGTYVDGERIGRSPVAGTHRSRIELGAVHATITFRRISSTQPLRLNMTELKRAVADRIATA